MQVSCFGTRYPWLVPLAHSPLPLRLLLSLNCFPFYLVVAYSRFHFTLLQLLNQGDLTERRTWAWVLTPGRAALWSQSACSGNRLLMADDLPEPKRICEQDSTFPLFIFPGIEDECRIASLQTTIWSRQGRSSECELGNYTYLGSHCKILGWTSPKSEFDYMLAEVSQYDYWEEVFLWRAFMTDSAIFSHGWTKSCHQP